MKIFDCFPFFNELTMLRFRLRELADVVDYFVLVESRETHTKQPKKLYFEENKHLYKEYLDKIIHVVIESLPSRNPFINTKHQRNQITRGLLRARPHDNDIICVCDADEITNPEIYKTIKEFNIPLKEIYSLQQDAYYYNLTGKNKELPWLHSHLYPYYIYKQFNNPASLRLQFFTPVPHGGWHFSYFGNPDFIVNKLQNFAHQEFNIPEFKNREHLQYSIKNNIPFFGKTSFGYTDIKDNDFLPKNYNLLLNLNNGDPLLKEGLA